MKRERRIPILLFVVCLAAAIPSSSGAGSLASAGLERQVGLTGGVSTDVSTRERLCHIPAGNPANAQTILVAQAAVAEHLAHGDLLGACPQACAGVPSAVPTSGVTDCWNESGSAIDCAGTGQDGELQKGAAVDPRFTDNSDGTVNDNLTGLIWLKNADCFGYRTWTDALAASNTLASGSCGLTDGSVAGDWRLPNIKELQSLIDFGQSNPALPVGHPFSGVHAHGFWWSSTAHAGLPGYAWHVDLSRGEVDSNNNGVVQIYTWPVRGGP